VGYTSDGDGLRQSRTVGTATTDFTWDVSGGLPLLLDDGTHGYRYGPSSAPVAQVDDSTGAIQYLHGDLIGSTRLVTDSSGTVVGTTEYDPYGNRVGHTGSAHSAIGYSGNWTDTATGLVYLRARDYDPATAQFLTIDPLVDSTRQPYAYVTDNPLNNSDPRGLCDQANYLQLIFALGMVQFEGLVNNSASIFNAMINDPDLTGQLIVDALTLVGGIAGEAGLGACDATGIGAVPCVPGGIALGVAIAGSGALMGGAIIQLANDAAGTDHVEPWQNASGGGSASDETPNLGDLKKLGDGAYESRTGESAHTLKQDILGKNADISKFNIYKASDGYLYLVRGKTAVPTYVKW
jgi:RHS repeat-associated protein